MVEADGFAFRPERPWRTCHRQCRGAAFSPAWLDSLAAENGRLLVPLTNAESWGGFLLITRHAGETQRYPAQFVHQVGSFHCQRRVAIPRRPARLKEALAKAPFTAIQSLRRAPEEPDGSCWLAGDVVLSTAPVPVSF